jgi:sugar lactone lactonase YvrE
MGRKPGTMKRIALCKSVLAGLAAAAALVLPSGAATSGGAALDVPSASTLAGSGTAGLLDGPAASARFMGPQGIAYDARGNLYVADTPAQRIRMVDVHGTVSTIAGSGDPELFASGVAGGYLDGPAGQAKFDGPAGVAVGRDGTLYVADFVNYCIRVVRNGQVTTLAGSPARRGNQDGPAASASFTNPRSVAVDTDGTVYVADYPNGIRKIAPDGVVSTMHVPWFDTATSVAVYHHGDTDEILVGTYDYVGRYDLRRGTDQPMLAMPTSNSDESAWHRNGKTSVGPPSAVAAINATELVYADALFSTVHLLQLDPTHPWHATRILGAQPLLNAGNRGGGFRDGPGETALFDQPTGVAVSPSGVVTIADTANKRIRILGDFNRRSYSTDHARLPTAPDAAAYRIAVVGDSVVWSDVSWNHSIGGIIQKRLCAQRHAALEHCKVEIYPLWLENAPPEAMVSYIHDYLSDGLVNAVVFLLPTPGFRISQPVPALDTLLRGLQTDMRASHTRLFTVMFPGAWELPNEMTFNKFYAAYTPGDPAAVETRYQTELERIRRSGTPYLNLWPAFFANDSQPEFTALYRVHDHHLSYFGNAFVGYAIAHAMFGEGSGQVPQSVMPPPVPVRQIDRGLPSVSTLAGTGRPGILDGPADRAEFEGPNGLAYDAKGNLYVADTQAQRIREIAVGGTVSTIAGSGEPTLFGTAVAGGYRDGAAGQARFDQPTGVAVGPNGGIYVADSRNHCIRLISNGTVTTVAGNPANAGKQDGPATAATFTSPRGIAVDASGTIFVADQPNGVRRISPQGIVSTMHVPEFEEAWNVSIYDRDGGNDLLVASRLRVAIYDLAHERVTYTFRTNWPFGYLYADTSPSLSEGTELAGPAMAVAALNANEFVYADSVFSTVHLVQIPNSYTRVLGAPPLLNAGVFGGGFRDGPGETALYQQPTGIAVGDGDQIAVADTLNRRVRLLSAFDRRTAGMKPPQIPATPGHRGIAIVGNSQVWANVGWSDSIAGIVNDAACKASKAAGKPCVEDVYPVRIDGATLADLAAYVAKSLAGGQVRTVYIVFSPSSITDGPATGVALRALRTQLAASGTRLVAVLLPLASDMPNESLYYKTVFGPGNPAVPFLRYTGTLGPARDAGVGVVDVWPAFFASDALPDSQPLFGSWGAYLTIYGNRLVGDAVAADALQNP